MDTQTLNFNKVHFVTSAPDIRHLPNDGGVEIAFAGRSNAGKSSALNTLTKHKNLARTSKTPGRTQLINLFELEPGKRLMQHRAAAQAAVEARVKHVVYTSLPSPDTSHVSFAPDHLGTEQALAASGLGWTFLRNAWYAENLAYALPSALASGEWVTAAGAGGVAYIAREDLALAAAVALASDSSGNRTFTLTGTQALNAREIAAKVSAATGRPLTVVDVTAEQLAEGLRAHGFPPVLADVFTSFDVATAAGDLAEVTDDFATLTGRAPSTFDAWLPANLALLNKAH